MHTSIRSYLLTLVGLMVPVHALGQASQIYLPTDVSGYSRGVDAATFDPALAASTSGFELALRSRVRADNSQLGGFVAVPIWNLGLTAGYESWLGMHRAPSRTTLGFGYRLWPGLGIGMAYRQHRYTDATFERSRFDQWDIGLQSEPAPWLSLSLGVDAVNAARIVTSQRIGDDLRRAVRAGIALRPVRGMPFLTFGADTRVGGTWGAPQIFRSRMLIDYAPLEGFHTIASYEHQSGEHSAWLGIALTLHGFEARLLPGALASGNAQFDGALSATVRTRSSETFDRGLRKRIEVPINGQLVTMGRGLLPSEKATSLLAMQLAALADDRRIETVVLTIEPIAVGLASVDELRQAIFKLRRAGKRVIAELNYADEKAYLVALAADAIRMDPLGQLVLDGFALRSFYLAKTLEKVGVRFDAVAIGRYKTGPDFLTREAGRPEEHQMQRDLLAQAMQTLTDAIKESRHKDEQATAAVLEQGVFSAKHALAQGLVDELTLPADFVERGAIRKRVGAGLVEENAPLPLWGAQSIIAVVAVNGAMATEASDSVLMPAAFDAKQTVDELYNAALSPAVKAVVLRINSPGGDVFAAELIWRAVKYVAERKPVVVSMGDVAASGGYYAAVAGDVIFAESNTVTGSIGIYTLKIDAQRLLEKLGVGIEVEKAGEHADWAFGHKPLSETARKHVEHALRGYYEEFVARVASGRRLSVERVFEIAEGRVYTGNQALQLGLVDRIGGLEDAVAEARRRAGLHNEPSVVHVANTSFKLSDFTRRLLFRQGNMSLLSSIPGNVSFLDTLGRQALELEKRAWALLPMAYEVEP